MATAQRAVERTAPYMAAVLAVMADIALIQLRRTQPHPTPHQEATEAVAEGLVAPRSRAGREQVRLLSTRLNKCGHSPRFEKT